MAARKNKTTPEQFVVQLHLMAFAEQQAAIAQRINEIATATLANKAIYEAEILALLARVEQLEKLTADMLKEVSRYGNSQ